MTQKDNFELQSNRIMEAVRELCSTCTIAFDEQRKPNWIKFRIESSDGTVLSNAYPEYHVSEVADWSDQKIRQVLKSLTAGKL
jgi:hypothetical protein